MSLKLVCADTVRGDRVQRSTTTIYNLALICYTESCSFRSNGICPMLQILDSATLMRGGGVEVKMFDYLMKYVM